MGVGPQQPRFEQSASDRGLLLGWLRSQRHEIPMRFVDQPFMDIGDIAAQLYTALETPPPQLEGHDERTCRSHLREGQLVSRTNPERSAADHWRRVDLTIRPGEANCAKEEGRQHTAAHPFLRHSVNKAGLVVESSTQGVRQQFILRRIPRNHRVVQAEGLSSIHLITFPVLVKSARARLYLVRASVSIFWMRSRVGLGLASSTYRRRSVGIRSRRP